MKNMKILRWMSLFMVLLSLKAQAGESAQIFCRSTNGPGVLLDLSDTKLPNLITQSGQVINLVISRDSSKLSMVGSDLDSFQMIAVDFQVKDLEVRTHADLAISAILNISNGPGAETKSFESKCQTTGQNRQDLLALKPNKKW